MPLRWIVRAVPERKPVIEYLQYHIPGLEVVWDKHRDGMETFLRAMDTAGDDPAVHLEDDCILTKRFTQLMVNEIHKKPNDIIQAFSRSKYDITDGSRYRGGGHFSCTVCFYIPRGLSAEIASFYDSPDWAETRNIHPTGWDYMMAALFAKKRLNYWIRVPSLVDHIIQPSQIGGRSARRLSTTFKSPDYRNYPHTPQEQLSDSRLPLHGVKPTRRKSEQ